ncbi:carbon storage regulator [Virgibacillus indicus]|uniref:Carbon storage regulator n=1 Tax=Virgibacillus indicus TaxID=2024554 RepID=A0A265N8S8_9BACI|nr:carbon storage regulator [Virgibacillus indicus]OZU88225.1 carbon storage regulator [Virgibacillus indicus]
MALTLGRKPGEKIYIVDSQGREIEIEVVKREEKLSNFTQLRISAPSEYQIIRGEIYEGSNSN